MPTLYDLTGYIASALVLVTFLTKDMRVLRTVAIFSNMAFIAYGLLDWLPPVLCLHLMLLPLNVLRLREIQKAQNETGILDQFAAIATAYVTRRVAAARNFKPVRVSAIAR